MRSLDNPGNFAISAGLNGEGIWIPPKDTGISLLEIPRRSAGSTACGESHRDTS